MKKGLRNLILVIGLIFAGTTTLEAMEMGPQENLPDCSVAAVGELCTLPAPESENPGQVDIEASSSSPSVLSEEKFTRLPTSKDNDPATPSVMIVIGAKAKTPETSVARAKVYFKSTQF